MELSANPANLEGLAFLDEVVTDVPGGEAGRGDQRAAL
jgi:hypothetical protein